MGRKRIKELVDLSFFFLYRFFLWIMFWSPSSQCILSLHPWPAFVTWVFGSSGCGWVIPISVTPPARVSIWIMNISIKKKMVYTSVLLNSINQVCTSFVFTPKSDLMNNFLIQWDFDFKESFLKSFKGKVFSYYWECLYMVLKAKI